MHLTQSELSRIFRALSALLHAGISPAEGAHLLAQEERGDLSRLLTELGQRLDQGDTLSEAMDAFPGWCRAMVAVGEETGRLEEALSFLADYCEEIVRSQRILRQSLAYPVLLFALMLVVIGLLLTKVLPVFDRVYASLGTGLTGLAGGLLVLGQLLEQALPVLAGVLGLVLLLPAVYHFVRPFKNYVNQKFQNTLADRGILRKFNNARFARALAMGIGSGLTAEEALALAGRLLGDIPGAARRCSHARQLLESGSDLPEALEKTDLLPPARGRMLAVGLRSGNVDKILTDVADRMETDARQALEDRLSRIEPALVLISAGLVGLILLSVMVPLLDILSALG